ncbi:MAG: SDR family oxidoreductase [Bacteroidia bacterium]|nr:SDR family oxidoreductase [Bacteroidia bacterium]
MENFKNKVVWITGASSGIGEALAHAFAAEGAKLVLSARREPELYRVKTLCKLSDEDCLILPFDLADAKNSSTHVEKIIQHFGTIDVLVNNGGVSQRSYTKDTKLDVDRKIMEVNYFSAVAITKSVLPYMLKQQSGHIVAISSISGKFGFYLRSAYSASKHALHGFFESLRLEVNKDNIKITLVCPGKINSNISVNALNAEGGQNNKMEKGHVDAMPAKQCAKQILEAIRKNKVEVFIGGKEINLVWIKRFFPNFFYKNILKLKPE